MRGNLYISIPAGDIANALPASITRYDWTENTYNEDGEVESTSTIHPTWEQYGAKYAGQFGAPVTISVNDKEFVIYEMTASWLNSEVSALISLGSGKSSPNYSVMTSEEARQLILDNSETQL